ncbi:MAG: glycosyltransferase [bacterium]|nr:glycosyltransferase [bacterium]
MAPDKPVPFVSVVIPVFNNPQGLARCLGALERQTYPRERYECVVVDNGSDESLNPATVVSRYPWVRLVSERKPGSYAARNRGVRLAKGEIIAFTDADCIPDRGWLENGVRCFQEEPSLALVAGDIEVVALDTGPRTAVEIYEQAVAFEPEKLLQTQKYGVTANLFAPRAVFDRVGWFSEDLKSGGDLEWGQRVHAVGLPQRFTGDARIAHPPRCKVADLYRKTVRVVGGKYDRYVRARPSPPSRLVFCLAMVSRRLVELPLAFLFHLGLDRRVRGFGNRVRYASMSVWVRAVEIGEIVRLFRGKPSSRD